MSAMQAEVFEAFRSIDVPEDKALKAAAALASAYTKSEDDTTKSFAKRDGSIETIGKDLISLCKDIAGVKLDIAGVKGEQVVHRWMLGFILAMQVAVLFKVFTH